MPVPKATMYKNDCLPANEGDIGFAGNVFAMQAIAGVA